MTAVDTLRCIDCGEPPDGVRISTWRFCFDCLRKRKLEQQKTRTGECLRGPALAVSAPDRIRQGFNTFGWSTNGQRKQWGIGTLARFIIDGSLTLHDQKTYDQLRNYVVRPNGDYGNADPEVHDDGVMALAIAITASRAEGPFVEDSPRDAVHALFDQQQWLDDLKENYG